MITQIVNFLGKHNQCIMYSKYAFSKEVKKHAFAMQLIDYQALTPPPPM